MYGRVDIIKLYLMLVIDGLKRKCVKVTLGALMNLIISLPLHQGTNCQIIAIE
jgi:hypothetical protein